RVGRFGGDTNVLLSLAWSSQYAAAGVRAWTPLRTPRCSRQTVNVTQLHCGAPETVLIDETGMSRHSGGEPRKGAAAGAHGAGAHRRARRGGADSNCHLTYPTKERSHDRTNVYS